MGQPVRSATLLTRCEDRAGIVHRLTDFVFRHGGNILHADQHIDVESDQFIGRIEWDMASFDLGDAEIATAFAPLAWELEMHWRLHFSDERPRIALFVSKQEHCLVDLLHRSAIGELPGEVALVISNHPELGKVAAAQKIPFHHIPITKETKVAQEAKQLELLQSEGIQLVVLARYMQVVTERLVDAFPDAMINIHHSFLPAFVGANPYARAHARGVKLVGATAHYVTSELDEGPIIEQDVTRVSHRDSVRDLVRKGRDLERMVLARAVRLHLARRVLRYGNRTVVFD